MCTKKQTGISSAAEKCRKTKRYFVITLWLTRILWTLFLASLFCKLFWGNGLVAAIRGPAYHSIHLPAILAPQGLMEVSKTLGVFSVFIGWIYAELGKSQYGRSYADLLTLLCRRYHLRALSYIASILACIFISKNGTLESAGIAILIALLGLMDQARVLTVFIFNRSVRKELAVQSWQEVFRQGSGSHEIFLPNVFTLADSISVEDDYCPKLCRCLADAMLSYPAQAAPGILSLSHIWERLLGDRPDSERRLLEEQMLTCIADPKNTKAESKQQIRICAGYLSWKIRFFTRTEGNANTDDTEVLVQLLRECNLLNNKLGASYPHLTDTLNTLFALLVWMHFLSNNIALNLELLEFLKDCTVSANQDCCDYFLECLQVLFPDDKGCADLFTTAWKQIHPSGTSKNQTHNVSKVEVAQ